MIANDNGPPDGDYVRYIEGLMARPGSTPVTSTKSQTDAPHERVAVHAMHGGASAVPTLPATQERPLDPTVADAMARALMMRTSAADAAPKVAMPFQRLVGAAGLALLLYGLFAQEFNFVFVLIGIALLNWYVKLRKRT